ncbi:MAG: methyl-accepting chemotaxis protein, partial [Gammaproteobacteria bacterium]|nr:methyl-accepting chemotaxis protein [Gammaproteobacteria bacterium]
MNVLTRFVRSKSGLVLLAYLAFCAAGSAGAAYLFHQSSLEAFHALAFDVPMAPVLEINRSHSYGLGLGLFAVLAGVGLAFSRIHLRGLSDRDAASTELKRNYKRVQAALDNMGEAFCMFDGQKRLVVWNDRYAKWYQLPQELLNIGTPHTAIIAHRVTQGILEGETNTNAVENRISVLDQLPEDASSSRIDQQRDGRFICVTRQPLKGGGWVATHTDVTEKVKTDKALAELNEEIDTVVQAAVLGDFSRRVDPGQADGVMLSLSEGMNRLLETVDRGLTETGNMLSALADGDLSKRMEGDYKGAFAQLKQDANSMADQIEMIAERISSVTGAVRGATREIASGIADLSARTEHQASSLEETTASMEELSSTVRQNADNAQEANQVSVAARDSADAGSAVAEKAVSAMGGIEESSRQITDIVGLIQEIAFQTNLLALNASVEAARAGDAGKGFAVVANEVRALAQRAATASKDIKELIVNSDNQVKAGVELVNQAGASLGEIVASVKKVADFVSEIAAASQEQSAGIDQVSNAITNMDEMTQQNASLVEETTAALTSAQTQLEDLRQAVGFFRTKQAEQAELREAGAD